MFSAVFLRNRNILQNIALFYCEPSWIQCAEQDEYIGNDTTADSVAVSIYRISSVA